MAYFMRSVQARCSAGRAFVDTHSLDTFMGRTKVNTTIFVAAQYELYISGVASNVHILTTDLLDQPSSGPHTDAPRVAWVRLSDNLLVPLPLFLSSD